jgi:hypothetical protein
MADRCKSSAKPTRLSKEKEGAGRVLLANDENYVSPLVSWIGGLVEECMREIGVGLPEGRAVIIAKTLEAIVVEVTDDRQKWLD